MLFRGLVQWLGCPTLGKATKGQAAFSYILLAKFI